MRFRTRAVVLAVALVGSLLSPLAATAAEDEPEQGVTSGNLPLVKSIPHVGLDGEGGAGSDIEFFTRTYRPAEARRVFDTKRVRGLDADPATPHIQRNFALAGTTGQGLHIYDISDPEKAYLTAVYDCNASQGDTQVFEQHGRTYTTYTAEENNGLAGACIDEIIPGAEGVAKYGTFVIDVTDPFNPRGVAHIPVPEGSHNGTVDPSGNFFYNSNSDLLGFDLLDGDDPLPAIEYYDISDIATKAPERLGVLPLPPVPASLGTDSHDITFNEAGDRAYSAALSQGVVIDTTNPANPSIISVIVDPTIQVWHQADPVQVGDREFLIVEDEVAGAAAGTNCPSGGVHVFNITGNLEQAPVKVGYWNIADVFVTDGLRTCTAHVFDIHEDAGIMTISYYNGGVRVVDLSGLGLVGAGLGTTTVGAAMTQLAFHRHTGEAASNSWAAKTPHINEDGSFYLYSNDRSRGLDIFEFQPGNEEAEQQAAAMSQWLTPEEAASALGGRALPAGYQPYCLLPQ